jgi:hypothetical protein
VFPVRCELQFNFQMLFLLFQLEYAMCNKPIKVSGILRVALRTATVSVLRRRLLRRRYVTGIIILKWILLNRL